MLQDDIAAYSMGLRHSQDRYLQLVREITSRIREVGEEAPPPAPTPQPPCDTRNIRKAVKSILGTQVEGESFTDRFRQFWGSRLE